MASQTKLCRWVMPVSSEPIEYGEVVFENQHVVDIRPSKVTDSSRFENAILMPGLVNVHTHLDYTVMRGFLEDLPFFTWIRQLTAAKSVLDTTDWKTSATLGAMEAIAGGVTTIGDCTDSGAALHGAMNAGLRGVIYQEIFGIDGKTVDDDNIHDLLNKISILKNQSCNSNLTIGVSPHSPYTLSRSLLTKLGDLRRQTGMPFCIHAAESQAETQLLKTGSGPIWDMYQNRGIQWQAPGLSSIQYLNDCGLLGPDTLLVHLVQLSMSDFAILNDNLAPVAYCPKSNSKLGNGVAPLSFLANHLTPPTQRIGLGSDSVASNNTMDMFEEMRTGLLTQRAHQRITDTPTAKQMVEIATLGGARALGMDNLIGSIEIGKYADLTLVSLNGWHNMPCFDPCSTICYSASCHDVVETIIDGKTVYKNGFVEVFNMSSLRSDLEIATNKLLEWKRNARN